MRQSGSIDSGERVHIYSADMRRSISMQFYPDGFDLVEPQPVLVSEGYSSHQAGTQGRQKLPDKFHVVKAGAEPQEIFMGRDIDMEAWQMQDKVWVVSQGPGDQTPKFQMFCLSHVGKVLCRVSVNVCCSVSILLLLPWYQTGFELAGSNMSFQHFQHQALCQHDISHNAAPSNTQIYKMMRCK